MPDEALKDIGAGQMESNYEETVTSFDEMSLKSELLRGVYEYGLECPSSVQQRAILPMIKGGDVIVEAPSATGKTLAFCISALQKINPNLKTCQALILASSAGRARQLQKIAADIGHAVQMDSPASVGGCAIEDDIKKLHDGQQFVIGSPGRVLDLIRRRAINIDSTRLLVLDEADEILSLGYIEHLIAIHGLVPELAQVVFSSVTMLDDVLEIATRLMRNPLHIVVKRTKLSLPGIKQFCVAVGTEDLKLDILSQMSATLGVAQAVIFCNTRKKLEWLSNALTGRGITNTAMHGDMFATERADIIGDFRSKTSRILLATNLLARGLDVQQTSLVVNYELPAKPADYIHRTSSSGRPERQCITVNLTSTAEADSIHDMEHHYSTQMEELSLSEAKKMLDFTGSIS